MVNSGMSQSLVQAETDDEASLPPGFSHPRLSGIKAGDEALYSVDESRRAARCSIRSFHSLQLPLPAAPQSIQDVMDAHHLGQQSVPMVGFGSTPTQLLRTIVVGQSSPSPVQKPPKSPPTPIPAKKTSLYDFPQYALDSFTPDADAAVPESMAELVGAFLPIAPQPTDECSTIGMQPNRSSPYPWMSRERSTGSISLSAATTGGEEHAEDALELFSMEII